MTVESRDICDRCQTDYATPTWTEPCPLCAVRRRLLEQLVVGKRVAQMTQMIQRIFDDQKDRFLESLYTEGYAQLRLR